MHCFQMYEICKTRFGKITIGKKDNKNTIFVRDDMLKVSSSKCQDRIYVLKPSTKCTYSLVENITKVVICITKLVNEIPTYNNS